MRPAIAPADLAIFRANLSKDKHLPGRISSSQSFVKTTADCATAEAEFAALQALYATPGEQLVPRPIAVRQNEVELELVDGIRAFDFLRLIRGLDGAEVAAAALLGRLLARLQRIQQTLANADLSASPYPFETKVTQALGLLSRVLGVSPPAPDEAAEAAVIEALWLRGATVPFRDAVAKNMILQIPDLAVRRGLEGDERRRILSRMIAEDAGFVSQTPIRDVDFSSVIEATNPADDWVSLQLNESASWIAPVRPSALALPAGATNRDVALSAYVRFVRFGSRKMAYRMLAPTAASVRFAFDDAGRYFRQMPALLDQLDPRFRHDFPLTVLRIERLSAAFARVEAALLDGITGDFWQESPLEGERFVPAAPPLPQDRAAAR